MAQLMKRAALRLAAWALCCAAALALMSACTFPAAPEPPPTSILPSATPEALTAIEPSQTPPVVTQTAAPAATLPPVNTPTVAVRPAPAGEGPLEITALDMSNETQGWAIGNAGGRAALALITADGGASWRNVSPPQPAPPDEAAWEAIGFFRDQQTAWVSYYNAGGYPAAAEVIVWRTADGGRSWQASEPLDVSGLAEIFYPTDFQFVDAQNGWLLSHVGVGMNHDYIVIFRTQDGGVTWQRVLTPFDDTSGVQACMKNELYFSDAQHGWLTGSCGGVAAGVLLFSTADGGDTWQTVSLPEPAKEAGLFASFEVGCGSATPAFFSTQQGYIVVSCQRFTVEPRRTDYFLYSTQDGGASWQSTPFPGGALYMLDAQTGWALGKEIFRTQDGWRSWTIASKVSWEAQFDFLNGQTGWAAAKSGEELALVYTLDGGRTWGMLEPALLP